MSKIDDLCKQLAYHRAQMAREKAAALEIEQELDSLAAGVDEGSRKFAGDFFVVTVTRKLTRKLDIEAYLAIKDGLPPGCDPVEYVPKLVLKKLRHLDAVDPTISEEFLTIKQAKSSIKIEEA